jgi:hypothetical protein
MKKLKRGIEIKDGCPDQSKESIDRYRKINDRDPD